MQKAATEGEDSKKPKRVFAYGGGGGGAFAQILRQQMGGSDDKGPKKLDSNDQMDYNNMG